MKHFDKIVAVIVQFDMCKEWGSPTEIIDHYNGFHLQDCIWERFIKRISNPNKNVKNKLCGFRDITNGFDYATIRLELNFCDKFDFTMNWLDLQFRRSYESLPIKFKQRALTDV